MGVTALFLASKYEEVVSPCVEDFVYITDNAYTSDEVREMEIMILKELNFSLGRPLPLHFLRRASKAGEVSTCPRCLVLSYTRKVLPGLFPAFLSRDLNSLSAYTLDQEILGYETPPCGVTWQHHCGSQ